MSHMQDDRHPRCGEHDFSEVVELDYSEPPELAYRCRDCGILTYSPGARADKERSQ